MQYPSSHVKHHGNIRNSIASSIPSLFKMLIATVLISISQCAKSDSAASSQSQANSGTDTIAPTFTASPASGAVLRFNPQIDFTFSESVTGATTTGNYSLSGSPGTLSLSTAILVSGNTYRITLNGSHTGSVTLTLNNIKDLAGNAIQANTITYPAPTCSDGSKNGNETGVDCGGSCGTCKCNNCAGISGANCYSNNLTGGMCQPLASCTNSTKDGNESDIDCGGAGTPLNSTAGCAPCAATKSCNVHSDCSSFLCIAGVCN